MALPLESMHIIRKRMLLQKYIGPSNLYDSRRIDEQKQARCANCDELWPWSMLSWKDGRLYCPNDFDSMNLREAMQELAAEQQRGANKPIRFLTFQAPADATTDSPAGAITSLTRSSGTAVNQSNPLAFTKGGAAVTLLLGGINMSSSDTIAYSTGISDNSAPVITTTLITLSLVASGAMTPGDRYGLTYNGTNFRNIFRVR